MGENYLLRSLPSKQGSPGWPILFPRFKNEPARLQWKRCKCTPEIIVPPCCYNSSSLIRPQLPLGLSISCTEFERSQQIDFLFWTKSHHCHQKMLRTKWRNELIIIWGNFIGNVRYSILKSASATKPTWTFSHQRLFTFRFTRWAKPGHTWLRRKLPDALSSESTGMTEDHVARERWYPDISHIGHLDEGKPFSTRETWANEARKCTKEPFSHVRTCSSQIKTCFLFVLWVQYQKCRAD